MCIAQNDFIINFVCTSTKSKIQKQLCTQRTKLSSILSVRHASKQNALLNSPE